MTTNTSDIKLFESISDDINDIFTDLSDDGKFKVKIQITPESRKFITSQNITHKGLHPVYWPKVEYNHSIEVYISNKEAFRLREVIDCVLTSIDYMKSCGFEVVESEGKTLFNVPQIDFTKLNNKDMNSGWYYNVYLKFL